MVATLLRLRFRVLGNTLTRSTWTLVATILGGLYALGVLVAVVAGLVALGVFAPDGLATTIVVLAGSVVVLGWILVPLLLTGVDQTLDPARLAQFPIPLRTLLIGLTAAGVLGVPGIVTAIASLATALAWLRQPGAAAAAIVGAVVSVLIAVVGSRAVTAASASLQSSRRAREFSTVAILVPLFFAGPIVLLLTQGLQGSWESLPTAADVLGWTPIGAAWAIPGAVASGDYLGALLRLLIGAATLVALVLIWRAALAQALVSPTASSGGGRTARGLGAFAIVPQTPAGAVMARSLVYWRRDPRYLQQLVFVPLIPILLWFYSSFAGGDGTLLLWSGPAVALTLSGILALDISYDGTAFATHLIDGVRGVDDRLGRFAAAALFSIPVTVVIVIGSAAIAQRWDLFAPVLGVSLGMLLTGFGVGSVSSAQLVVPVPEAGANPFKAAPGQGFTTGLKSLATVGVTALFMIPAAILMVLTLTTGSVLAAWATFVVGIGVGVVIAVVGVRVGGSVLDRTGPTLLATLRRMRNA